MQRVTVFKFQYCVEFPIINLALTPYCPTNWRVAVLIVLLFEVLGTNYHHYYHKPNTVEQIYPSFNNNPHHTDTVFDTGYSHAFIGARKKQIEAGLLVVNDNCKPLKLRNQLLLIVKLTKSNRTWTSMYQHDSHQTISHEIHTATIDR